MIAYLSEYKDSCIAVQSFAKLADSIFFQVFKYAPTLIRVKASIFLV